MSIDLDLLFGRKKPRPRVPLRKRLSEKRLVYLHESLQWSLREIGAPFGVSGGAVSQYMRTLGIVPRTQSAARFLAQDRGKLLEKRTSTFDTKFFQDWTPKMAYVLGLFYSDGSLSSVNRKMRVSMSQKEPELLQKCLGLLGSNARLGFHPKQGISGEVYFFSITNQQLCEHLFSLGVIPKKSLILTYPPTMPANMARHFIRGCWDGDGSIYQENRSGRWGASYTSGSIVFIEELLSQLEILGMKKKTIHKNSRAIAYYFRFTGRECGQLSRIFYDDVPEDQYLTRKYDRFQLAALATAV